MTLLRAILPKKCPLSLKLEGGDVRVQDVQMGRHDVQMTR